MCCNVLQCAVCFVLLRAVAHLVLSRSVLQCVVVCCSVMQRGAAWLSVVQCVAQYDSGSCSVVQCGAVYCVLRACSPLMLGRSMLQYVAVCCSVLQCVAVCCSVLQCVAVCCVLRAGAPVMLKASVMHLCYSMLQLCCSVSLHL